MDHGRGPPWVGLLSLLLSYASVQSQNLTSLTFNITTGQQFVSELRKNFSHAILQFNVASAAIVNVSEALLLPADVSGLPLVSDGYAVLQGALDGPRAAIDWGQRYDATAPIDGQGPWHFLMNNIIASGICFKFNQIATKPPLGWRTSQHLSYLTWRNPMVGAFQQRLIATNSTTLTTRGDVRAHQYVTLMTEQGPLAPLLKYTNMWLFAIGSMQPAVRYITPESMSFRTISLPIAILYNCTLASFGYAPHVLERNVTFSLPRMCAGPEADGRLLTPEEQDVDFTVSPLWLPTNKPEFVSAVADLVAYSRRIDPRNAWPPAVMLLQSVALNASDMGPSPLTVPWLALLHGPFNHVPETAVDVVLHLGHVTSPWLVLAVNGTTSAQLMVHRMSLAGLGSAPLGPLLPSGASAQAMSYQSALPLWAFSRQGPTWNTTKFQILIHNSTLVLPQSDYAALLSAARRGPSWQSGANTTAPLLSGISQFVLGSTDEPDSPDKLFCSSYVGWGVSATSLSLEPEQPLGPCFMLPDDGGMYEADSCAPPSSPPPPVAQSQSHVKAIGLGVGLGVGLTLLLVIALVLVLRMGVRRERVARMLECLHLRKPSASSSSAGRGQSSSQGQKWMRSKGSASTAAASESDSGTVSVHVDSEPGTRRHGSQRAHSHRPAGRITTGRRREIEELRSALASHAQPSSGARTTAATSTSSLPSSKDNGSKSSVASHKSMYKNAPEVAKAQAETCHVLCPHERIARVAEALNSGHADKVTLHRVLGKGTFGVVYEGEWRGLPVAVKTVVFGGSQKQSCRGRSAHNSAVHEAAVCMSLAHANVVATYHYDIKVMRPLQEAGQFLEVEVGKGAPDTADFKLYLVQECCTASLHEAREESLLHDPATHAPLMLPLLSILMDMARGVEYLHSRGIIHGDLKPENILLKADLSCCASVVAKLADFGLSTFLDVTATHVSNWRKGTPCYMAPEVKALNQLSRSSDVYAAGVVIWELATDTDPFVYEADGTFKPHPALGCFPDGTDPALVQLVTDCLRWDPHTRPTATELCIALGHIIEGMGFGSLLLQVPQQQQLQEQQEHGVLHQAVLEETGQDVGEEVQAQETLDTQ